MDSAFHPARGLARARGVTEVRHPQCAQKATGFKSTRNAAPQSSFSKNEETANVGNKVGQHGGIFYVSP